MNPPKRIQLVTHDSIHLVKLKEILYCKGENTYTIFHLIKGNSIRVSKNIKAFENLLKGTNFFRSHQSYLVNMKHVVKIDKTDAFTLVLSDNSRIPSSIRKKKDLLRFLNIP